MIKSYKEITGKYLKANKKRTALTLIGIILSVSLISAIGFFLRSMQEAQIVDMKNAYGSWHVMYNKVDEGLIEKIKNNPVVLRSGTYAIGGEESISENLMVRKIFGTDEGLELMPYRLKEGRFPETSKEAAVEKWFLDRISSDGKLGDSINILDKEYTLVGILEDSVENQSDRIGELLTKENNTSSSQKILLAELKLNRKLQENINELKKLADDEKSFTDNQMLLAVQGKSMPGGMVSVVVVIIGIVIISTIAVIYNAFQIGVVDRIKQFGLLRAVGTTPRQIRKIILREALILAVIGVPLGIFFGIAALYGIDLAFRIIGRDTLALIHPKISLDVISLSILIGLGSIYISAFIPAVFAGKISPLIAISSRNSITKEKLKRRKSLIMGRIFGYEGALASKNIKRNRKRYRITVFSIVISVTLFISFKSFMDMSLNVYSDTNESSKAHFYINKDDSSTGISSELIKKVNGLPQVAITYSLFGAQQFTAAVDKGREVEEIREIGDIYRDISYEGKSKTLINSSVIIYDSKSLDAAKTYIREGSFDIESLNRENGVIIIGKNSIFNPKTERRFYGPIMNLKPGDEIHLQLFEYKDEYEFGKGKLNKVKVLAVLEDAPLNFRGNESGLKIITTEEVAKKLGSEQLDPVALNVQLKDVKLEDEAKRAIVNIISDEGNLILINRIDMNRSNNAVIIMVKILLYGFVIVVSLIGSVNIINTLTTNIILRRREFAALKSIGLTQRGLRKIISLEGILYGIMGSFYGSIAGLLLSYTLYRGVSDVREQIFKIPYDAIAIAASGAIIIGYLSVLAPLRRMKKDNLVEAVREEY